MKTLANVATLVSATTLLSLAACSQDQTARRNTDSMGRQITSTPAQSSDAMHRDDMNRSNAHGLMPAKDATQRSTPNTSVSRETPTRETMNPSTTSQDDGQIALSSSDRITRENMNKIGPNVYPSASSGSPDASAGTKSSTTTPMNSASGTTTPTPTTNAPTGDIIDIAVGPGMSRVTTLVAAVKAADLVATLKGPGPFTVFAPTNEAFAKLPAGTLEMLLKPENKDKLRNILLHHVHAGEAIPAAKVRTMSLTTASGQPLSVVVDRGNVMVGGAKVIKTDVTASNGIIHWIDTVIVP